VYLIFRVLQGGPLDGREQIFLSMKEAVFALRTDFFRYPPQIPLFMDLTPLILGSETRIVNDSRTSGLWICTPGRGHVMRMRNITPSELGHLLIRTLEKSPPSVTVLAEICARTFLVGAEPYGKIAGADAGVRMHVNMEGYQCRQCGRCCRELDYRNELRLSDYQHWIKLGRDDILERVATITHRGQIVSYAIWVEPGTRQFAAQCPWLSPANPKIKSGRWFCRIHDCKPTICRDYPGTEKHARMTGCIGFTK
jgi:Fe-S-cluster containining protein